MKEVFHLLVFVFFLSLIGCTNASQTKTAEWITYPNFEHKPNQWFIVRNTFNLDKKPEQALARIAADSKYWLWINGELVVSEGQLKRGPTPNDTYYDEVDLKRQLNKGDNTVAILVWYFGRDGFSHKDSKQFGLLFDAQIDDTKLVSDTTWRISRYKAYKNLEGGKCANFRLPEGNVQFDAREEYDGWTMFNFDDSNWKSPTVAGIEGSAPWNKLVKRPIPQWKDFGLKKVPQLKKEGNLVKIKLPYNMQFNFWMKVKALAGKKITVKSDNYDWLNDTPIRGQYVTKEGIQEYEHLPWMSGHEIICDVEEGVEILAAGYRETGYDTEFDGTFKIDDPYLMRFLDKAKNTLYINMRDTYFDCPDRERAQWWGDMVLLMEESFFLMDNNAIALSTKGIKELVDWQKPDGSLFAPIPAGNWDQELPHQMLAVIGVGFKNYLMYTGDVETIKYVYPAVKKYLSLWEVNEEGHVTTKERNVWGWYDHGDKIDAELLEHAWYSIALETYAHLANLMEEPEEAEKAIEAKEKIKGFVNKYYWTSRGYRSINYKHDIDDRGNGLMVVAGIAQPHMYDTISKVLKEIRNSSPYIDKYQLDALFMMGKKEQAMVRIKERYKNMVNAPDITTLWEVFDQGNWSYNHGWSGGPLIMMYKYIAGIRPVKAGFKEFVVFPDITGTGNISCEFSTVKGVIALNCQEEAGEITQNLLVPQNSTAIVKIPANCRKVKIDGEGNMIETKDFQDPEYHYYRLSPGKWKIEYALEFKGDI